MLITPRLKEVGSLQTTTTGDAHRKDIIIDRLLGMCSRLKNENNDLRAKVRFLETKIERYRREFMIPPYSGGQQEIDV